MICQPRHADEARSSVLGRLRGLALVLGVALGVRVLWVILVRADPMDGRFDDTVFYRGSAHYLAHGAGYVNPFSGAPTALWPPGYPLFLAGVFKLFGEGATQTSAANVVLSVATIAIVYCIGLQLFDHRTALVASAVMAVWPGQVYFTSVGLSEPLFTLLFALAVLLALLVPATERVRRGLVVAGLGAAIGLAALTRSQGLALVPLPLAAWLLAGMKWRTAIAWWAGSMVVTGLVLGAWAVRNERTLGTFALATSTGPNLLLGHHDDATGRAAVTGPLPLPDPGSRSATEYEVVANNAGLRAAIRYARGHPADELALSGAKIRATYESDATALDWIWGYAGDERARTRVEVLRGIANAYWFGALILAGIGLVTARSRARPMAAALPLLLGMWTFAHVVFFGDPRFHYPVVFVVALFAGNAIVTARSYVGSRNAGQATAPVPA